MASASSARRMDEIAARIAELDQLSRKVTSTAKLVAELYVQHVPPSDSNPRKLAIIQAILATGDEPSSSCVDIIYKAFAALSDAKLAAAPDLANAGSQLGIYLLREADAQRHIDSLANMEIVRCRLEKAEAAAESVNAAADPTDDTPESGHCTCHFCKTL
jgi:hypothetical protein